MSTPRVSLESERRFVLRTMPYPVERVGLINQGYLLAVGPVEVRVRTGSEHSMALKIAVGPGRRYEFESNVPPLVASLLLRICRRTLSKVRYVHVHDGQRWDIDCYEGSLDGLRTAEAETSSFDTLVVPSWVGDEVTGRRGWSNRSLARHGFPSIT